MMSKICIYHADDDGFGAAWVVRKVMGETDIVYHPTNYGLPVPEVDGLDVIIVDFSFKRDIMLELIMRAKSVLVLDHHKTAEAELSELSADNAVIKFEQGKSGVLMTWEHYYGSDRLDEPMPDLIDYLDAGDLWQLGRRPDIKQVQAALRSYPYDFKLWDEFMTPAGLDRLRQEGGAIRRFIEQKCDELLKTQRPMKIDGYEVPAVNAPWFLASELAGRLAEMDGRFGVCYYDSFDGRSFSLRGRNGFDVSVVAKKFGGGGHTGAAGFRMPL